MARTSKQEKRTTVFIDFESWYYSLTKHYKEKPDIKALIQDIKGRGKLEQIYCFADFTMGDIALEKDALRLYTNFLIDCSSENPYRKNFTDFILLDHAYQHILRNSGTEQYIFVTGDAHFSSLVSFLVNIQDRQVGVYAVKGCLSSQLERCANWTVEILPKNPDQTFISIPESTRFKEAQNTVSLEQYKRLVLQNLAWTHENHVEPTFAGTVDTVARNKAVPRELLVKALRELVDDNYIDREHITEENRQITKLTVHWDKLEEDQIWQLRNPFENDKRYTKLG